MKLFTIPNILTLLNLLCGCIAIVFAFDGNLVWSAYLVGIAAVLDFLDGFAARALKQYSEIGKQLDSLADMVTFGVVPGVVMFQLLHTCMIIEGKAGFIFLHHEPFPYVAFLIPLFSALRLAKFNIDTRQSDSFIGVPTPANAILICSFALILGANAMAVRPPMNVQDENSPENALNLVSYLGSHESTGWDLNAAAETSSINKILLNKWFLVSVTLVMSFLLISEIPLFSLKFKSFGWKGNEIRWVFLAMCVVLLATLQFIGIPLAIVLYIVMSVVSNISGVRKAK